MVRTHPELSYIGLHQYSTQSYWFRPVLKSTFILLTQPSNNGPQLYSTQSYWFTSGLNPIILVHIFTSSLPHFLFFFSLFLSASRVSTVFATIACVLCKYHVSCTRHASPAVDLSSPFKCMSNDVLSQNFPISTFC
jgi:hypothetical protein